MRFDITLYRYKSTYDVPVNPCTRQPVTPRDSRTPGLLYVQNSVLYYIRITTIILLLLLLLLCRHSAKLNPNFRRVLRVVLCCVMRACCRPNTEIV